VDLLEEGKPRIVLALLLCADGGGELRELLVQREKLLVS
jgi:hypothetical protein